MSGEPGGNKVVDLLSRLREQNREIAPQAVPSGGGSGGGGGGNGSSGAMEARVARLEVDVEHIKRDIGDIKSDIRSLSVQTTELRTTLATLTERVAHLPSKDFIVKVVVAAGGLIGALVLFQGNIQKLFGLLPH
jgi:hypothetical protein